MSSDPVDRRWPVLHRHRVVWWPGDAGEDHEPHLPAAERVRGPSLTREQGRAYTAGRVAPYAPAAAVSAP